MVPGISGTTNTVLLCHNCHSNNLADPTFSADSPAQHEADLVQRQLQRIDNLKELLDQQWSYLLRELNTTHSTTRSLEPEILASIFQWSCGEEKLSSTPIRLGAVCSAWRQVAYSTVSTPQLWKCLNLRIETYHFNTNATKKAAMLGLYLENVGSLRISLSLALEFPSDDRPIPESAFPSSPVLDIILNKGSKFKALFLYDTPANWVDRLSRSANFANLEFLSLGVYSCSSPNHVDFSSFSGLHTVRLMCLRGFFRFLYTNITNIQLHGVPVNYCAYVLFHCCNLVDYRCSSPEASIDLDVELPSTIVVLPYLETLEWCFKHAMVDRFIIRYLDIPSLSTFRVSIQYYMPQSDREPTKEDITRFSQRCLHTYSKLEISKSRFDTQNSISLAKTLLTNSLNVETFSLHAYTLDRTSMAIDLLLSDPIGNESPCLPKLLAWTIAVTLVKSNDVSMMEAKLKRLESRGWKVREMNHYPFARFHLLPP